MLLLKFCTCYHLILSLAKKIFESEDTRTAHLPFVLHILTSCINMKALNTALADVNVKRE